MVLLVNHNIIGRSYNSYFKFHSKRLNSMVGALVLPWNTSRSISHGLFAIFASILCKILVLEFVGMYEYVGGSRQMQRQWDKPIYRLDPPTY